MKNLIKPKSFIFILPLFILLGFIILLTFNLKNEQAEETYTVTFDANGGVFESGETILPIEQKVGYVVSRPNCTKENFEFRGWGYYPKSFRAIANQSSVEWQKINTDVTLYAQWYFYFEVNYYFDDGSFTTHKYISGDELQDTLMPNQHMELSSHKNDKVLVGWNVVPNADKPIFKVCEPICNLSVTPGSVLNLYPVWRQSYLNHYAKPEGSGTIDNPYLISNDKELAWLSFLGSTSNYVKGYYKQVADIDLSEYEWYPICDYKYNVTNYTDFCGTYDGGNYTISNLSIHIYNLYCVGLFGSGRNATISNVIISSGEIEAKSPERPIEIGAIIGQARKVNYRNMKIENCKNFASIFCIDESVSNSSVGGIVGEIESADIVNCANYGDIVTSRIHDVGGIVGATSGHSEENNITACIVDCCMTDLSTPNITGAIVGDVWESDAVNVIESCVAQFYFKYRDDSYYCDYDSPSDNFFTRWSTYTSSTDGWRPMLINNSFMRLNFNELSNLSTKVSYFGNSSVIEINGEKYFKSSQSYSEWGIMVDNTVLPKMIAWQAQIVNPPTKEWFLENGYKSV